MEKTKFKIGSHVMIKTGVYKDHIGTIIHLYQKSDSHMDVALVRISRYSFETEEYSLDDLDIIFF